MAINVRNLLFPIANQDVATNNAQRLDMLKIRQGTIIHADATTAIALSAPVDLPTSIAVANQLKATINAHLGSACNSITGQGSHIAVDGTNPVVAATAVDLLTTETLLNACKTSHNAHIALTTVHPVADATNTVVTANATDLPTSIALGTQLITSVNAHMAMAMVEQAIILVAP